MSGNLLGNTWALRFVKHAAFPRAFQYANLVICVTLIALGYGVMDEASRYTNVTPFVVWVVWWPGIVFLGVVAARSWCTVCHLRLLANLAGRISLRLRVPVPIRHYGPLSIAACLGLFVLHSTVVSFDMHHSAGRTAIALAALCAYAVIAAWLFGARSFCRHFCPLAPLVASYAHLSPTELRIGNPAVCARCGEKLCMKRCPSKHYPGNLNHHVNCLLCFECVKACPADNVQFVVRPPAQGLWASSHIRWLEVAVVALLLSMMLEEVGELWGAFAQAMTRVPAWIEQWGVPGKILGSYQWLDSFWVNLMLPATLLGLTGISARVLAGGGAKQHIKMYALCLLPLIFSIHAAMMWRQLNSKAAYFPMVLRDPVGMTTSRELANGMIGAPKPIWLQGGAEGWSIIAIVFLGMLVSLYSVIQRSRHLGVNDSVTLRRGALPFGILVAALGVTFLAIIHRWFGLSL